MTKKRILIVGMLDSVHFGRWISQFEGAETSFTVFSSKKFRSIHPTLLSLLSENSGVKIHLVNKWLPKKLAGYADFLLYVIPAKLGLRIREWHLAFVMFRGHFDYIHALEIQGAGYLVDKSLKISKRGNSKVILTNWGSDIYYFLNFTHHRLKIQSALSIANFYSAECVRDYSLARDLGFTGTNLPCIPNAGGFKLSRNAGSPTSQRKQIIVKCYGGQFGRGKVIVEALQILLPVFPDYRVFLYSVTDDLLASVLKLQSSYPGRIRFSPQSAPVSHEALMKEFDASRVYVGASISDGISTSFLEALVHGCYPIQTNSSCASEWITLGAVGSIPAPVESEILFNLKLSLLDDNLVDNAQKKNFQIAKDFLDFDKVKEIATSFYKS